MRGNVQYIPIGYLAQWRMELAREAWVGNDVGNGGIEDRGGQFCRTKPCRNAAWQAIREAALDSITGDHRHVDHQPQRDHERCHRNL